ncbi:hypothetical protein K9M74_01645 [Candidatus Woesearchaeota archaeon]|nr:hypothetical protein [Candidatus Woesearchaeota archaeon]
MTKNQSELNLAAKITHYKTATKKNRNWAISNYALTLGFLTSLAYNVNKIEQIQASELEITTQNNKIQYEIINRQRKLIQVSLAGVVLTTIGGTRRAIHAVHTYYYVKDLEEKNYLHSQE